MQQALLSPWNPIACFIFSSSCRTRGFWICFTHSVTISIVVRNYSSVVYNSIFMCWCDWNKFCLDRSLQWEPGGVAPNMIDFFFKYDKIFNNHTTLYKQYKVLINKYHCYILYYSVTTLFGFVIEKNTQASPQHYQLLWPEL
jgi:hypothetical protein